MGDAGHSVGAWRAARSVLSGQRPALARAAARLYPGAARAGATDLLTRPQWLPSVPWDLDDVLLHWVSDPPEPALDGTGAAAAHVLPLSPAGGRYASYSAAIAGLDRPALFENRVCYRLLEATLAGPPGLSVSRCAYFAAVDVGHAVAHELAAVWQASPGPVSMADLPLRAAAGDPCDLLRRPTITAATTLTLRRDSRGQASYLVHWRDPAKVNHAGGVYQVMPVGIFQPLAGTPASLTGDLSLFKNIAREFSEEFLGTPEVYPGSEDGFGYGRWPFYTRLAEGRRAGRLVIHCLGLGVDPLTFATDLLTVAVFDAPFFDEVFSELSAVNAEGRVLTERGSVWIPFDSASIDRFAGGDEPVQPAGAAVLRLAWQHRGHLLA